MVHQIKEFKDNALALALQGPFTEADAQLIEQLFEEKLTMGYEHVNILIQVKDLSVMKDMNLKAFFEGELWGVKHFGKIGRCAVVAHSDMMKTIVKVESKVLRFFSAALEERYFDEKELDEAIQFITPAE